MQIGDQKVKNPKIVQAEAFTKRRENVYAKKSSRMGFAGFFESFLRRFRNIAFMTALTPLYLLGILAMGISATPGIYLLSTVIEATNDWTPVLHYMAGATSFIAGYFIYGLALIFVVPFFNFIMPFRVKPFRGGIFSLESVPWYIHNAFTYIVRYTFLEFITPTPINLLFYRMMGMKIGKGVHLNTTNISDPALIEIEDHVTVGGSAHIIAHYATKGFLVLSKVKIEKGATIGLKATVMGDVVIGPGATIAPHEVVLPKTRIPASRRPAKQEIKVSDEKEYEQRSAV